jgi:hypothetical protein
MLRRLARWLVRDELARLRADLATLQVLHDGWKVHALSQERYRLMVHGEGRDHEGYRAWWFREFPTREARDALLELPHE